MWSNFYPYFWALWDEFSDVDSRRHQSRGPQRAAASTRLKSGVVKPFDLNSSFSVTQCAKKWKNIAREICIYEWLHDHLKIIILWKKNSSLCIPSFRTTRFKNRSKHDGFSHWGNWCDNSPKCTFFFQILEHSGIISSSSQRCCYLLFLQKAFFLLFVRRVAMEWTNWQVLFCGSHRSKQKWFWRRVMLMK